jgi:hypothetical protein
VGLTRGGLAAASKGRREGGVLARGWTRASARVRGRCGTTLDGGVGTGRADGGVALDGRDNAGTSRTERDR